MGSTHNRKQKQPKSARGSTSGPKPRGEKGKALSAWDSAYDNGYGSVKLERDKNGMVVKTTLLKVNPYRDGTVRRDAFALGVKRALNEPMEVDNEPRLRTGS